MKKILIADDSEYVQEKLKLFIPAKYSLVFSSSGAESRKKFKQENPDLVLLDIVMPEGDEEGVEVLRDIKKINPKANVVIISAIGADRVKNACTQLGVTDYIEKPFNRDDVQNIVKKYLGA